MKGTIQYKDPTFPLNDGIVVGQAYFFVSNPPDSKTGFFAVPTWRSTYEDLEEHYRIGGYHVIEGRIGRLIQIAQIWFETGERCTLGFFGLN